MKFTFYKNNKISGKHQKTSSQILREFYETEDSQSEEPFERKLLSFMKATYGSFDRLTEAQWEALYIRKDIYNPA